MPSRCWPGDFPAVLPQTSKIILSNPQRGLALTVYTILILRLQIEIIVCQITFVKGSF